MIHIVDNEPYVGASAFVLLAVEAVLDPNNPKENKQRAQSSLDEFIRAAKAKGCKDIEKTLYRGVIDEFTIAKAEEMGALIEPSEFLEALSKVGVTL